MNEFLGKLHELLFFNFNCIVQVYVGDYNKAIGDVNCIVNEITVPPQESLAGLSSSNIIIVVVISLAAVGCVILIILKLVLRRRYNLLSRARMNAYVETTTPAVAVSNPLWLLEWPKYEGFQLDRDSLTILRELGSGEFGMVYLGSMKGKEKSDEERLVAIKTMKMEGSREKGEEFKREMELMMEFSHPHIVTLIGVCTTEQPVYIVTELMDKVSLEELSANLLTL